MTGWFDIFRAHLFADMCWYKNNRWLLFYYFIWPYLMVALILGFGSLFGSIESYSERLGVSSPILFLLSSTVVAMSSISIVSSVAEFVIENRWSGTLPYIMLTPAEMPTIFIAAGLPDAIISPLITMAAIFPAALYLEGISGGIRILTILIFIFLGMLPLLGFSALIASLTLIAKEESNVGQIIIPFLLLVSGVYYPLEVLPSILQFIGRIMPVAYVVEAARLFSKYIVPEIRIVLILIYILTVMTIAYNLLASLTLRGADRALRGKGVI